jgi:hypothetical protein
MGPTMGWVVALLMFMLALAAGARVRQLWRAGLAAERPLLLHRVTERNGFTLAQCFDPRDIARVGHGARGCLLCRGREDCHVALDRDAWAEVRDACPNIELIDRLSGRPRMRGADGH